MGAIPGKEGGSISIWQNSGILIENPLAGEAGQKNATKSEFDEFASMEKYAQLLLILRIWQSKKFDKPSNLVTTVY
jgi:hypothetical protein